MMQTAPILNNKAYEEPSVFTASNLLRAACRQKSLIRQDMPPICVLDPDGDIVQYLIEEHGTKREPAWACYHTDLYTFEWNGVPLGIVGRAVGASFAVLVAEELFAVGCQLLISVTSAGQILATQYPPYFILIDKALRDEGTSYHYLPASQYSYLDEFLLTLLTGVFTNGSIPVERGTAWTTDAPFRETASAIAYACALEIRAVEMEAAALYAFATATGRSVVCLAHVTNQMAQVEGDFEKGVANGSRDALNVVARIARTWLDQKHTDCESD